MIIAGKFIKALGKARDKHVGHEYMHHYLYSDTGILAATDGHRIFAIHTMHDVIKWEDFIGVGHWHAVRLPADTNCNFEFIGNGIYMNEVPIDHLYLDGVVVPDLGSVIPARRIVPEKPVDVDANAVVDFCRMLCKRKYNCLAWRTNAEHNARFYKVLNFAGIIARCIPDSNSYED